MALELVGIDLAKNVFHLHGMDGAGREVLRRRVCRGELLSVMREMKGCRVVMESCAGSNYWAREIEKLGHTVQLIAPHYVKPYVQRNKTDFKDAEAICVAARQPTMRYVPRKSIEQQDVQSVHRVRERLVRARTALVNEIRGLLGEYGIVMAKGRRTFAKAMPEVFLKEQNLTPLALETFQELWQEYVVLDERIAKLERKIRTICTNHPICQRLLKIPGVGILTATAIIAAIGDAHVFRNGREFAAWVGLTPVEHSTGGRQRLFGISKRGDVYLRTLLIHGARITLRYLHRHQDRRSVWAANLLQRRGVNRASVALANKNARVIWALIAKDEEYRALPIAA